MGLLEVESLETFDLFISHHWITPSLCIFRTDYVHSLYERNTNVASAIRPACLEEASYVYSSSDGRNPSYSRFYKHNIGLHCSLSDRFHCTIYQSTPSDSQEKPTVSAEPEDGGCSR